MGRAPDSPVVTGYSIIPARAISAFTAMRCSTLSDCRLLSRAAVSSLSPVSQFLPKRAVTTGGSVLRAIRADCAFSSVLAFSNSATRACNSCELSLLVSVVITSFGQLDPRIPICCLITAENRRVGEGDVCKRPNLASDVCYASVRDFIGHPELYGWSGQGTEPGAALANFPYDLRKVFGEQIAAQFEIPPHNLCPRDHAGRDCGEESRDRKSTRLNSSHVRISYAVFCLKKKTYTAHT